jgi:hypothetical protein
LKRRSDPNSDRRTDDLVREGTEQGIEGGELRGMSDEEIAVQAHFLLGTHYFLDQMIEGVDGRDYPGDEVVIATHLKFAQRGLSKETS